MAAEAPKGDVQAALEAIEDRQVTFKDIDWHGQQVPIAFVPDGMTAKSLKPIIDEWRPWPERMTGRAQLNELESLAAYINRHKREETLVFIDDSDPSSPSIEVVFDAHEPESVRLQVPEGEDQRAPVPGWQQFRAGYDFPMTPEWKAWHAIAGEWIPQARFANFLEERIDEVIDPSDPGDAAVKMAEKLGMTLAGPGRLLEISRGLQVRVNQNIVSAQNLASGEVQVVFEEKHTDSAGAPIKVPGGFAIGLPVFRGGAIYRIPVRLRYRTEGGRLVWQILPHRLDRVFENAIEGAAADLRAKTALPVLRGRP